MQPRVRHNQIRCLHSVHAIEQQIQVDNARAALAPVAHASLRLLDGQQRVHQILRRGRGLDATGGIDEIGLIADVTHRRATVQ